MRKKNYKGRCEKRIVEKCTDVCRTYDAIQATYAGMLSKDDSIKEFTCNVHLEGMDYSSDFVCLRNDGTMMVRECVWRKYLAKPMTVELLEKSREYWRRHGIADWGVVTDAEE